MKYLSIILAVCATSFISCKKEDKVTNNTIEKLTPFEAITIDLPQNNKRLFFKNNQSIIMYATKDSISSQIKTLDNIGAQHLYFLEEDDDFYKVYFQSFGNNPQNLIGYIKKKELIFQEEFSLEREDLYEIRYAIENGITNDKNKTFAPYGSIKLISKQEYDRQNKKSNEQYIFSTKDVVEDDNGNYTFITQTGKTIEVPIHINDEVTIKNKLIGFAPILQSYVFETKEESDVHYSFYSRRTNETVMQLNQTLPVYNKNTQKFAQLYNDSDVGSLLIIQSLNSELEFTENLLINFTQFKTIPQTLYWISDYVLIAEVLHTNQTDESKSEYIMIQLK